MSESIFSASPLVIRPRLTASSTTSCRRSRLSVTLRSRLARNSSTLLSRPAVPAWADELALRAFGFAALAFFGLGFGFAAGFLTPVCFAAFAGFDDPAFFAALAFFGFLAGSFLSATGSPLLGALRRDYLTTAASRSRTWRRPGRGRRAG